MDRVPPGLEDIVDEIAGEILYEYEIAESDFGDYLSNLEEYEESLVRGEIQW